MRQHSIYVRLQSIRINIHKYMNVNMYTYMCQHSSVWTLVSTRPSRTQWHTQSSSAHYTQSLSRVHNQNDARYGVCGGGEEERGGGVERGRGGWEKRTCSSARPTLRSRSKSGNCSTSASQYISMRTPSSFKTGIPEISCSCINRSAFRTVSLACTVTIFCAPRVPMPASPNVPSSVPRSCSWW